MTPEHIKQQWHEFKTRELSAVTPLLAELGFVLDIEQVHISGERYLHRPHKLVLTGVRAADQLRVVIKASSHPEGVREIRRERACRTILHSLEFAYRTFLFPEELLYIKSGGHTIFVTAYIEQTRGFLEHSLRDQFFLAMRAFEMQEGAHAVTSSHIHKVHSEFDLYGAKEYLDAFASFQNSMPTDATMQHAHAFLANSRETLELYCGFLTHDDFVPHNIRVKGTDIYLLDHTALHFGNKYEGWARFLNFMTLYNRPLEIALTDYVLNNRGTQEYASLCLMRAYKIGFLLQFYTASLEKTSGDLHTLTQKRLQFWTQALEAILNNTPLLDEVIENYKRSRDTLRSSEEKRRQRELQQL